MNGDGGRVYITRGVRIREEHSEGRDQRLRVREGAVHEVVRKGRVWRGRCIFKEAAGRARGERVPVAGGAQKRAEPLTASMISSAAKPICTGGAGWVGLARCG